MARRTDLSFFGFRVTETQRRKLNISYIIHVNYTRACSLDNVCQYVIL